MGINIYGRKIEENSNIVRYKFGCDFDNLSGELSIRKKDLELTKIFDSLDNIKNIAFLKIGCKLIKIYNKEGKFPDYVESIS